MFKVLGCFRTFLGGIGGSPSKQVPFWKTTQLELGCMFWKRVGHVQCLFFVLSFSCSSLACFSDVFQYFVGWFDHVFMVLVLVVTGFRDGF